MRRIISLFAIVLLINGCATTKPFFSDVAIRHAEQNKEIYTGMSLTALEKILKTPPMCGSSWFTNNQDTCRTDHLPDGDYFTWIVGSKGGNWTETYSFTFKNNRLVSWGHDSPKF